MARQANPRSSFEGREGSRWINRRPTAEEFAEWFATVPLDEGMQHEDFIGGLTLISANETVVENVPASNGEPVLANRDQVVYIPYPKVETRVAYFWKLMETRDWVGVIEPIDAGDQHRTNAHGGNIGLPPGFFYQTAPNEKGVTTFICCSYRVAIYERESYMDKINGKPATPVRQGRGTKQVALLRYADRADENALMKAETGAVGRALGMAAILVIPGAGVATAEDMLEALASEDRGGPGATTAAAPGAAVVEALPAADPEEEAKTKATEEETLRATASEAIRQLQADFPEAWTELAAWAQGRKMESVGKLTGPTLKGFVRKAEKTLDEARKAAVEREGSEDTPIAPEAPETAPGEPTEPVEEAPDGANGG